MPTLGGMTRATVDDVHALARGMPGATTVRGQAVVYQVRGKSFVFFRNPRPDAFDPETGERYDDVIVFWVGSDADKTALRRGRVDAVLHHAALQRAPVGAAARLPGRRARPRRARRGRVRRVAGAGAEAAGGFLAGGERADMTPGTWELRLFYTASALIALHVADDNFFQPEPGMSAADHLLSGLVPLGVLAAVAVLYGRMRAGLRAVCAIFVGVFGLAAASEAIYYTAQGEIGGDDFTGWLCVPAGLTLFGVAAVTLWKSRWQTRNRFLRYSRRFGWVVAAFLVLNLVGYPFVTSYVVTHSITAKVPEPELDYEDVSFTTSDGLRLEGWYLPSENGAAVIVFPARAKRQDHARMLADNGYGVLLFDRRGEGVSEGDPNLLGWGGDRDLKAAVDFLEDQPDVEPDRIGGIGLSVGGELLIEAAAEDDRFQAIVSEGAGARSYREVGELNEGGPFDALVFGVLTGSTRVFSNEPVPPNVNDLVADIAPRSVFLVYGENGQPTEDDLNPTFYESAGEPKEIWEVPDAGHIQGLATQPEEYEERVVGFLDEALLGP